MYVCMYVCILVYASLLKFIHEMCYNILHEDMRNVMFTCFGFPFVPATVVTITRPGSVPLPLTVDGSVSYICIYGQEKTNPLHGTLLLRYDNSLL